MIQCCEFLIYYPIIGPTLIIVGFLMFSSIKKLEFTNLSESLPAYLTIIGIPLTYSISDGIAFGMISYPIIKILSGKAREVSLLMYILAGLFIIKYVFLAIYTKLHSKIYFNSSFKLF